VIRVSWDPLPSIGNRLDLWEILSMGKLSATAVKAARGDQDEELEIPPREMERIVHEMMTREYTRTLDEAVPALGDKTPRALARTKAGRAKVADWLKYLENGAAKTGAGDPMAS